MFFFGGVFMKVIQSLNQNALLVCDENQTEFITLGRGIGFGKKKGDSVETEKITSYYKIHSTTQEQKILDELKGIEEEVLAIAEEVATRANKILNDSLNESFVFSLANHIQFSIKRHQENELPLQPFQYEIKYLYPKEYELAVASIEYINEHYALNFPESEIAFFTLHFVNGLKDTGDFNEIVKLSNILNEIIHIIETEEGIELDKSNVDYSRFVVHLRYFLIRQLQNTTPRKVIDSKLVELYQTTEKLFLKEVEIVSKVKEFLRENYDIVYNLSEDFYLLLHIIRINKRGI